MQKRGHWWFNVDAVEKYFGIQINKPEEMEEKPIKEGKAILPTYTRLITENFFQEVIKRACSAKSSIEIMTEDPEIIASLNERFSDITSHKFCDDCHRKKDCLEDKM